MTIHLTMKAIQIQASGGPDDLQLQEIPKPVPTEGEVLVRVHTAAVQPEVQRWHDFLAALPGAGQPAP